MNFCRGSRCSPPGRQSLDRAGRSVSCGRPAARAASGESHKAPRENQRITASGCFSRSRLNVGSSSSRSAARNAVGKPPTRMVQYA